MKPNTTHQEILIYINTFFAHRQWASTEGQGTKHLNTREKLEKACWDGLIKELIPELDITLHTDKKLWLWQVHGTRSFLALDFYESPGSEEVKPSIDPSLFMNEISMYRMN